MSIYKRLITIFTALLLIIIALTSCTKNVTTSKVEYIDDETDDSPLQVYLLDWDDLERTAIQEFNKEVSLKNINGRKIKITEFNHLDRNDMYQKIRLEMMSGKGPDVIFTDRTYSMKNDFYKMSQNGSFADMDVLAGTSETFDFSEYNEVAMEGSIIDGTRVLMPYSYYVPYGFTTEEVLESNGIELPDVMTYEALKEIYTQYHENNEPRFDTIVELMFIDIFSANSTIDIDSDILRYFLEKRKESYDNGGLTGDAYNMDVTSSEYILSLFPFAVIGSEYNLMAYEYNETNKYENNIKFIKMPCDSDGNTRAYIDRGIAININSKHKNDAFKLVEYIMSYSHSLDKDYKTIDSIVIPVYTKAYESFKKYFNTDAVKHMRSKDDNSYTTETMPEAIANDCIDIIESPTSCVFGGQGLFIYYSIVLDLLQDYYDGKIDYDELIASIKNKYDLYKSE